MMGFAKEFSLRALDDRFCDPARLQKLVGYIHTLAKQMGTSVLMLERFYSKLTATAAATELA